MDTKDIPDWAIEEALKRADMRCWGLMDIRNPDFPPGIRNPVLLAASLIAKHEQPPVDPDWEEAAKLCRENAFDVKPWTGEGYPPEDRRYAHHAFFAAIKRGRELERDQ